MRICNKAFLAALAAGAVVAVSGSSAIAGTLGVAEAYNAFIFQNMNETSDAQGALAVGGDFTVSSYSVASSLGNSGVHLVVGGNATFNGGSVNGTAVIGGNATFNNIAVGGDIDVEGNYSGSGFATGKINYAGTYSGPSWATHAPVASVTVPIDFAAAKTALTNVSDGLAALATTGSFTDAFNALKLTGTSSSANIFSVSAAVLAAATSITVNMPTGGYALINVTGATTITLPNVGFSFNDNNVLWNLNGYTNITMHSFAGSVLAPGADVNFVSGNLNGTLVANSLHGGGELHNYTFDHDFTLPTPPLDSSLPVPLPSSVYEGIALIGALAIARRFRKTAQ